MGESDDPGFSSLKTNSVQGVYKGVRAWSRRTLEKASERVMDVAGDDDYDEENIEREEEAAAGSGTARPGGVSGDSR